MFIPILRALKVFMIDIVFMQVGHTDVPRQPPNLNPTQHAFHMLRRKLKLTSL